MNIFVLDTNATKCARYHCDKHVVKMTTEAAQILCTVNNLCGLKSPYRSTHVNHPCVIWAGRSKQNWLWLFNLAKALNDEYKYRYRKGDDHKAFKAIKNLTIPGLPKLGITTFAQAMPSRFRIPNDAVTAYRNYYVAIKYPIASWTRRKTPHWYTALKQKKSYFCNKVPKKRLRDIFKYR